jgi:hypothetical protein
MNAGARFLRAECINGHQGRSGVRVVCDGIVSRPSSTIGLRWNPEAGENALPGIFPIRLFAILTSTPGGGSRQQR